MNKYINELRKRYARLYIKGDYEDKVTGHKDRLLKSLILLALCFILLIFGYAAGRIDESKSIGTEDGKVISIERPDSGSKEIELGLGFNGDEGPEKREITLDIDASDEGEDEEGTPDSEVSERTVDDLIRDIQDEVENDPAKHTIVLPTELSDGTEIVWYKNRDFRWLVMVILFLLMAYLVYRSRFDTLKKEEKAAFDDISLELPGFINKCVLLLNGGLVLTDVLARIVSEYEKSTKESYLYNQLASIMENYEESNTPIDDQLMEFAGNAGSRELSRIASIILDNLSKGSSLVEKLEAESGYLWFMRKKKAEELGRLAETKLTFPLMILLISLITVTVAPAMLEM